jgi:NADPH:quinone reductase-like Zn-dependent oxidoreductase
MKALVKEAPGEGLTLKDVRPSDRPDDVLIRVRKTGVCGTDIHIWNWDAWAARTVPTPSSPATNSRARSWSWAATSPTCGWVSASAAKDT